MGPGNQTLLIEAGLERHLAEGDADGSLNRALRTPRRRLTLVRHQVRNDQGGRRP